MGLGTTQGLQVGFANKRSYSRSRCSTHPLWMYPTTWSSTKNSTNCPFLSCKTQTNPHNPHLRRFQTHAHTWYLAYRRTQRQNLPFLGCRCQPSGSIRKGRTRRRARCRWQLGGRRSNRSPPRQQMARRKKRRRLRTGRVDERRAGGGAGISGERWRPRRKRRWRWRPWPKLPVIGSWICRRWIMPGKDANCPIVLRVFRFVFSVCTLILGRRTWQPPTQAPTVNNLQNLTRTIALTH